MYQILIVLAVIFRLTAFAQSSSKSVEFEFHCVPTSTYSYTLEITRKGFYLTKYNKIPKKWRMFKNAKRIKKTITSDYIYSYNQNERQLFDSIVKAYYLDSVEIYLTRVTKWGKLWKVKIERNSLIYDMSLPNFHNDGLEILLKFVACLIPEEDNPKYGKIICE